jgi:hypothetical protein
MATAELTISANIEGLRRELEKIGPITADQATAMTNQLNKSIKAAEKASIAAAKASKAASEGAKASGRAASEALDVASASATRFGDKAGAVGSNAGKLAGILDMLVPGLGGVARGVADVADTAEVASVATKGLGVSMSSTLAVLGPVAIAVAALGATYAYLAHVLGQAEAKQAAASDAAQRQADATKQWTATKMEANDAVAISADKNAAEGIAIRKATEAVKEGAAAARAEADQRLTDAKAKTLSIKDINSAEAAAAVDAESRAMVALDSLDESIAATVKKRQTVIAGEFAAQRAIQASTEAQVYAANAAAKRAADEAALAEVERGLLEQTQTYRSVVASLGETTRATTDSQLAGTAAIEASLARQIEKLSVLAATRIEEGKLSTEQILAVEAEFNTAKTALEVKAAAEIDDIHASSSEKRTKEREAELAAEAAFAAQRAQATASATSDLLGTTSSAFAAAAEEQGKTNKDAAMAMFAASKAAAVAQAVVNTALAISSANTLPPPANFIAMAAAGISGAVALGAIASSPPPSFNDTPGVMSMGQRGNVSLASGDYFAAARSPTELQRQVGASAGGGGVSILQVRLGHKVLDQSVARTIQEGGRLSREISGRVKSGTTGHRSRA